MVVAPGDSEADSFWATQRLRLRRIAQEAASVAFLLGARAAEADLGAPNLYDADAQAFILEYEYTSIRSLTVRSANLTRQVLLDGIRAGEGVDDIARSLDRALEGRVATVEAIARTEANRSANYGRFSGWRKAGFVQRKEYLATLDDRVRPDHLAAHGEVAALDAPFARGAAAGYLMPPVGVNCRCTAAPITSFSGVGVEAEQVEEDRAAADAFAETLQLATKGCPTHIGLGRGRARDPIPGLIREEERHAAALRSEWRKGKQAFIALFLEENHAVRR